MRQTRNNQNMEQKSLLRRFLFFIGMIFLILYVVLGIVFIVWKDMPVTLPYRNRVIFGIILLVYAVIRSFRIINNKKNL